MQKKLDAPALLTEALQNLARDPGLAMVIGSPGWHKQEMAKQLAKHEWTQVP